MNLAVRHTFFFQRVGAHGFMADGRHDLQFHHLAASERSVQFEYPFGGLPVASRSNSPPACHRGECFRSRAFRAACHVRLSRTRPLQIARVSFRCCLVRQSNASAILASVHPGPDASAFSGILAARRTFSLDPFNCFGTPRNVRRSSAVSGTIYFLFMGSLRVIGRFPYLLDVTPIRTFGCDAALGGDRIRFAKCRPTILSGLILLFERPIDGGFDESDIGDETDRHPRQCDPPHSTGRALPNGMLISDKVTNWTLSDRRGRTDERGGRNTTYPPRVIGLLLDVAKANAKVIDDAEPVAFFIVWRQLFSISSSGCGSMLILRPTPSRSTAILRSRSRQALENANIGVPSATRSAWIDHAPQRGTDLGAASPAAKYRRKAGRTASCGMSLSISRLHECQSAKQRVIKGVFSVGEVGIEVVCRVPRITALQRSTRSIGLAG